MLRIFVIANYLQPQLQLPSGCLCSCVQEGHVLQPQLQVPLCPWLHDGQIFSASSMVKYIINNYPTTFHFYYNTRVKAFLHDKKTTSLGLFDTLFSLFGQVQDQRLGDNYPRSGPARCVVE